MLGLRDSKAEGERELTSVGTTLAQVLYIHCFLESGTPLCKTVTGILE